MIPGFSNIDAWEYLPPRKANDSPHSWFTYVTARWVADLATASELDDLLPADWEPANPSTDGSEKFSHYASGQIVTMAYVEGVEIRGLCGASVIPHRDPQQLPICAHCVEAITLLRTAGLKLSRWCWTSCSACELRRTGTTALIGRRCSNPRISLSVGALIKDAHHLGSGNTQSVAIREALDATFLT